MLPGFGFAADLLVGFGIWLPCIDVNLYILGVCVCLGFVLFRVLCFLVVCCGFVILSLLILIVEFLIGVGCSCGAFCCMLLLFRVVGWDFGLCTSELYLLVGLV